MIRSQAFDPDSGAPLAAEKEFPPGVRAGRDQGRRLVENHPLAVTSDWGEREGSMTNGELCSSGDGLLGYFRRVHRKVRTPNPALDRAAAAAIRQVRRTDAGRRAADTFVWYVVAERLAQRGYWSAWMLDHCIPRCPYCRSMLKFRPAVGKLEGVCARNAHRHGAVDEAIRERIHELYAAAFGELLDDGFDPTDFAKRDYLLPDTFVLF